MKWSFKYWFMFLCIPTIVFFANPHFTKFNVLYPAQQDWNKEPITIVADGSAADISSQPSLDDFCKAFDVVFVDVTGYLNLCADVSIATYQQVNNSCYLLFAKYFNTKVVLCAVSFLLVCVYCSTLAILNHQAEPIPRGRMAQINLSCIDLSIFRCVLYF